MYVINSTLILLRLLLLSVKLPSFFNGSGAAWKVENDDLAIYSIIPFQQRLKRVSGSELCK